jgi:hypothetical protein
VRAWPLAYLQGIVNGTSRTNGRQFAEYAGEARPDGMQRLLSSAIWEFDLVRDDLRSYVLEQLGDLQAIVALDETSLYVRYHQHSLSQRSLARSDTHPPNK